MKISLSEEQKMTLKNSLQDSYMEVFPTPTIESKLDDLQQGSYIAVTCSPVKGIDETLEMTERLVHRGFKVIPHVAAKMVRDKAHLTEIITRINDLSIDSLFVPGGDAKKPAGIYHTAFELLQDIAEIDHNITHIGVAAHPEGHPMVDDDLLLKELLKKQEYANYLVTQMCFDAKLIAEWIKKIREYGITLPVWLGIPGTSQRGSLLKTSLRIGVGNSLKYLKNHKKIATKLLLTKEYRPDNLLLELASCINDPYFNIEGHHIYCFNAVDKAEGWRNEFMNNLNNE
ncbi:MAG: methylenetetrahydrofolate reductase [Gammaproteobacteria bacterium]|nr:methylenetetrahydrofolate reductase [Gammaproteobacteria bacterium]